MVRSHAALVVLAAFFIFPVTSSAKAVNRMRSKVGVTEAPTIMNKPWTVRAEIAPLLLKGFGLSVARLLSPKFEMEGFYLSERMSGNIKDFPEYRSEHHTQFFGARLNVAPLAQLDNAWYVSAGVTQVVLDSRVNAVLSGNESRLVTSRTGYLLATGYQFSLPGISSIGRFGGGYATGGTISNNLGGTKNLILDGPWIEGSFGFVF